MIIVKIQKLPVPYRPLIDKAGVHVVAVPNQDDVSAIAAAYAKLEQGPFSDAEIGELISVNPVH